ncbi:unnamed protein product [Urochloa humidicola]
MVGITWWRAWSISHKGKATSDVRYNLEHPPEAYSNATIHNHLNEYSEVAKQVHGPDWDSSTHDLDGEVIMRVEGGKKHGQYYLGDSTLYTASTPTLSQIRARTTDDDPPIRSRPTVGHFGMQALQTQLEEERRRREELEAKRLRQHEEAERQRQMAEQQRLHEEAKRSGR